MENSIIGAAKKGNLNRLKKILRDNPNANPGCHDNNPLLIASIFGHIEVVRYLVSLPGVDHRAGYYNAFRSAAKYGKLEVVRFLSTLGGIDARIISHAVSAACCHFNVVEFLTSLPEFNVTTDGHIALKGSVLSGDVDMLKYLLTFKNADITKTCDGFAITRAAAVGNLEMVKFLSTVMDPHVGEGGPITFASHCGNLLIVKFLMTLPGVDPSCRDNDPFHYTYTRTDTSIAKELLKDVRVREKTKGTDHEKRAREIWEEIVDEMVHDAKRMKFLSSLVGDDIARNQIIPYL